MSDYPSMCNSKNQKGNMPMMKAILQYGEEVRKVRVRIPFDLTQSGLSQLVARHFDSIDHPVEISRLSTSHKGFVKLNSSSSYEALFRSLKVKRKLHFLVTDATSSDPKEQSEKGLKRNQGLTTASYFSLENPSIANDNEVHRETSADNVASLITNLTESKPFKSLVRSVMDEYNLEKELSKQTLESPTRLKAEILPTENQKPSPQSFNDLRDSENFGDSDNQVFAFCDGCFKSIISQGYKCSDCPDFEFCSDCIKSADNTHPGHSFVIFNSTRDFVFPRVPRVKAVHSNCYCDGPGCADEPCFITGARFKCAICPDFDLCENCEALPNLDHNETHPFLKIKQPIDRVSVDVDWNRTNHFSHSKRPSRAQSPVRPKSSSSQDRYLDQAFVRASAQIVSDLMGAKPSNPPATLVKDENNGSDISGTAQNVEHNTVTEVDGKYSGTVDEKVILGRMIKVSFKNTGNSTWDTPITLVPLSKCDFECSNAEFPVLPGASQGFIAAVNSSEYEEISWQLKSNGSNILLDEPFITVIDLPSTNASQEIANKSIRSSDSPMESSDVILPRLPRESPSISMNASVRSTETKANDDDDTTTTFPSDDEKGYLSAVEGGRVDLSRTASSISLSTYDIIDRSDLDSEID